MKISELMHAAYGEMAPIIPAAEVHDPFLIHAVRRIETKFGDRFAYDCEYADSGVKFCVLLGVTSVRQTLAEAWDAAGGETLGPLVLEKRERVWVFVDAESGGNDGA